MPLYALDETSDITGWEGANIIHAGSGTKNITTGDANTVIYTESASGTVTGGNGQDTFYSGSENSHFVGRNGSDTYIFTKGHGQDVIYDYGYSSATETDTLIFTDVRSSEVKFGRSGDNLILFGYNGADKITIEQFFTSTQYSYAIEIFKFTDKTITYDEYMAQGLPLYALDETSDITGWEGVNIIHAGSGTKNITTGNANNVINTESASGTVTGGNSQDTFYSGSGNSRLVGGNGSDTYIFAKGHGQDVIYDYGYSSATETDTLIFTDVKSSEVKFGRSGDDLILFGYNGADKITIEQFFTSTQYSYAIEVFQFADKVITYDELIKTSIPAFTAEDQASLLAAQAELDVARTLSQVMSPASYLMNDELFGNNGSGDTLSSFSTTQNNQTQADIAKEVQSLISAMASFGATDGGSIQVEDQTYGYLSAITVPN